MHTLQQNFLQNEKQIEKFVKLVIKSLKVLTHEFMVGVGAWRAPTCLRISALPSAPPSFSGSGQSTSARVLPNLVLQRKLTRAQVCGYEHGKRNQEVHREA